MCLAVPGKIVNVEDRDGTLMSIVDFGGIKKDVCLQYIPDAEVGEYVVVHVGFALQRLDEESAKRTLAEFEHLGVLKEEFGDGFELAGPNKRVHKSQRGVVEKYLDEFSDPDLARKLVEEIKAVRTSQRWSIMESVWRADAFDHQARYRSVAARRHRDDPRPGLPRLRHPAGDHRQGLGDRLAARCDLLLVRRHAQGAR